MQASYLSISNESGSNGHGVLPIGIEVRNIVFSAEWKLGETLPFLLGKEKKKNQGGGVNQISVAISNTSYISHLLR